MQRPLADGRTLVEVFVAEHPGLTDADRQIVLGWREVVEAIFEMCDQAEDVITATSLADGRTYRIRANAGPGALAPMQPGCFMVARLVPVGDEWMLSGAQRLYPASERAAMPQQATELATGLPIPLRRASRCTESVTRDGGCR